MKPKDSKPRRPPKISNTRKPDEISFEEWQTSLRKQFSTEQPFTIKNLGDHSVFSDFEVRNRITQKKYRVAIRSREPGLNFCSCPDFKVNNLGTCKHVEAVFNYLEGKKNLEKILNKGYERPYSSVTLKYGAERKIVLRTGSKNPDYIQVLAKEYFNKDGILKESAFGKFEKFLEGVKTIDEHFRCYPDAVDFIIAEREKQKRIARIQDKFPDGISGKQLKKIISTELYPYQEEAVLKAASAGRFIIADDMGLGKTIQSIAVAELLKDLMGIEKVMIICPTSLKYQWETEIQKFTKSNSKVIEGAQFLRAEQYNEKEFYNIVSYNAAVNDIEIINKVRPDLIILDEAQRIKNWKTKTAQSIKQLDSTYCLVLTGTPLENKLEELHSLVEFVDKYKMGLLAKFLFDHQITDDSGKVTGYKDLNKIGKSIESICIRRTKREVLKQLPPRIDKTLMVAVTQKQLDYHNEFYDNVCKLVNKWRRFGFLNEKDRQMLMIDLNRMRMVSDSTYILDQVTRHDTKIAELRNTLEEIFQNKEDKVVIFSQWERMTRLVSMELEKMGIKYEYLHGGIPALARKDLITNFKNDPECRVFLSTDAGSVGLNLQSASVVINMDCPWNPAVLEQRIGRIHRLGQEKPVTIINFISKGTIEERMLGLLSFKKQLFEGVLDGGEDIIFMGESKMKQFMKTVEKLTEESPSGENIPTEDLISIEDEAQQAVDDLLVETDTIREYSPEINAVHVEAATPKDSMPQTPEEANEPNDLLKTGLSFLEKLSDTLSNPEKTKALVNGMMETDANTGKSYLKIPVESGDVVNKVVGMLAGFLNMLKK